LVIVRRAAAQDQKFATKAWRQTAAVHQGSGFDCKAGCSAVQQPAVYRSVQYGSLAENAQICAVTFSLTDTGGHRLQEMFPEFNAELSA
jgi:hypothetical protein